MINNTGTLYIKSTGKNTFFSVFKNKSEFNNLKLLKIFSCGQFGFKGRKKETPFSCSYTTNKCVIFCINNKITKLNVIFKGVSLYKKIILNTLFKSKFNNIKIKYLSITDITNYPHNGCRSRKIKKR